MQVTKAPPYRCNSFSASIYASEIELHRFPWKMNNQDDIKVYE